MEGDVCVSSYDLTACVLAFSLSLLLMICAKKKKESIGSLSESEFSAYSQQVKFGMEQNESGKAFGSHSHLTGGNGEPCLRITAIIRSQFPLERSRCSNNAIQNISFSPPCHPLGIQQVSFTHSAWSPYWMLKKQKYFHLAWDLAEVGLINLKRGHQPSTCGCQNIHEFALKPKSKSLPLLQRMSWGKMWNEGEWCGCFV